MDTLYEKNGLVFWTEREIKIRQMLADYFLDSMTNVLRGQNKAFEFHQIEAPLLTPLEFINPSYSAADYYAVDQTLVLRPETTMGSYQNPPTALYLATWKEFSPRARSDNKEYATQGILSDGIPKHLCQQHRQ